MSPISNDSNNFTAFNSKLEFTLSKRSTLSLQAINIKKQVVIKKHADYSNIFHLDSQLNQIKHVDDTHSSLIIKQSKFAEHSHNNYEVNLNNHKE